MGDAAVTDLEDRLTKILTPIAGLLTAAGGIAGISGALGPVVRGSERLAFLAFSLMVIGFAALVIVRLFMWAPSAARARRTFLGIAVVAICSSLLLFFAIAVTSAGRDQRPVITATVVGAARTTITGSVTSGGMSFDERLAVDVFAGPGPAASRLLISQVTGPDATGSATVKLDTVLDVDPGDVVIVQAWLPDRSADQPDCLSSATPRPEQSTGGAPATSSAPIAAPTTRGLADRVRQILPQKEPYVSCLYIEPTSFGSSGPQVSIAEAAGSQAIVVDVKGPVATGEAILLRVWDRARAKPLLHSMLIYPDSTGMANSLSTIGIGTRDADICAVAVQGDPGTLHTTNVPATGPCRSGDSTHQGWAELVVSQPSPPPASVDPGGPR